MENWRPIGEFTGFYEISDLGNVRRIAGGQGSAPGRIRKPSVWKGYQQVQLSIHNRIYYRWIHRLVAAEFLGHPPNAQSEVNHLNGNPRDNRVENLEWTTRSGNTEHAYRMGFRQPAPSLGSKNGFAKLTESDIPAIRARRASGETIVSIGKSYGIAHSLVSRIYARKSWAHVP